MLATNTSTTSRRALLTGAGAALALPAATASAGVAASLGAAPVHPDAGLLRLCAEHIANRAAYCASGDMENDDDPLWSAYYRTLKAIDAAKPRTIDGILAKARAAKAEGEQLDEWGVPMDATATDWAWHLVNDMLRLNGGVA